MDSICNPCSRRNCVSKLTHWCSDCEDGLCEKCFNDHKVMKMTQSHRIVDMSEIPADNLKLLSIPQCERHPDCREDFICLYHDVICCHACIKSDHKECKKVSNVNVLSKGVSKSELFIANMQTLQEVRDFMHKITEERQSAIKDVTKQQQIIKMEIANTKSKFMEHINNLEKVLIHELTNIEKDNRTLIEDETTDIMKTVIEVEEDANTLQFVADHGSESQLFTLLTKRKKKHEKFLKMLIEIPPTSRTKIGFEEACHEIKAIKALGFLSVHFEIVESLRPGVRVKEYEDAVLSASDKRKQTTTPSTGNIHKFPLKDISQIQLDPKDFVEKNETYTKLNLQKVWITVRDDNCLFVAGHVVILMEQTGVNGEQKCKNNYRVAKYIYDEKGPNFKNGLNICYDYYDYSSSHNSKNVYSFLFPSKNIAFSCIPKSNLAVLLHDKSLNLIDTDTMERQWCLDLNHDFQTIATDEKGIYITNQNILYQYSRIGCFMKKINFINCTSFASSLSGGNFAAYFQSDQVYWLNANGSVIFSYHSKGIRTVNIDNVGNIYLESRNGIQILDPVKMETEMMYKYDEIKASHVMGVACNRINNTLFLLFNSSEREEFGYYGQYNAQTYIANSYNSDIKRYVCPSCKMKYESGYCTRTSCRIDNRYVNINEFSVQVLINSEK